MLVADSCFPIHYFCNLCGAEMPLWFGASDRGFVEWLRTPCRRCGVPPRRDHGMAAVHGSAAAFIPFTEPEVWPST